MAVPLRVIGNPNQETIETCRSLLREAEAGNVVGLAYMALHRGSDYSGHVVGRAKHTPVFALGLLRALEIKLSRLIP